ncbi:MAG: hypothetical protein U0X93_15045 [Anaerolineales bacterium]
MLVSQVFFATDMHEEHGMHDFYNSLPISASGSRSPSPALTATGLKMVSVKQRYEGVFEWLNTPGVMCLRFEDLVNNRDATLNAMLDEVEKDRLQKSLPARDDRRFLFCGGDPTEEESHLPLQGRPGGWREFFTTEHKSLFKEVAGDFEWVRGMRKQTIGKLTMRAMALPARR